MDGGAPPPPAAAAAAAGGGGAPPSITRAALEKVLRSGPKGDGAFELVRLKLADPSPARQLLRYAWAQLASVENAAAVLEVVRGAELPVPSPAGSSAATADGAAGAAGAATPTVFRIEPIFNVSKREPVVDTRPLPKSMSVPSRAAYDAAQSVAVMRRLDARRGVEEFPFTDDRLAALPTPARRVDYASAYLRAVQAYDYYSGNEFVDNPSTKSRLYSATDLLEADRARVEAERAAADARAAKAAEKEAGKRQAARGKVERDQRRLLATGRLCV
ncbi:hypothetical protein I4F81_010803 [Pyropia yezoensis]|uniref:Uncharacterized protein n=1 Tax=Pyropia yezoensis TaxID=2788 RepID=A0ACC3CEE7_PYRYE|nr:hypothetical protein I4F81_010803 [Neopyropia yezoensis]